MQARNLPTIESARISSIRVLVFPNLLNADSFACKGAIAGGQSTRDVFGLHPIQCQPEAVPQTLEKGRRPFKKSLKLNYATVTTTHTDSADLDMVLLRTAQAID